MRGVGVFIFGSVGGVGVAVSTAVIRRLFKRPRAESHPKVQTERGVPTADLDSPPDSIFETEILHKALSTPLPDELLCEQGKLCHSEDGDADPGSYADVMSDRPSSHPMTPDKLSSASTTSDSLEYHTNLESDFLGDELQSQSLTSETADSQIAESEIQSDLRATVEENKDLPTIASTEDEHTSEIQDGMGTTPSTSIILNTVSQSEPVDIEEVPRQFDEPGAVGNSELNASTLSTSLRTTEESLSTDSMQVDNEDLLSDENAFGEEVPIVPVNIQPDKRRLISVFETHVNDLMAEENALLTNAFDVTVEKSKSLRKVDSNSEILEPYISELMQSARAEPNLAYSKLLQSTRQHETRSRSFPSTEQHGGQRTPTLSRSIDLRMTAHYNATAPRLTETMVSPKVVSPVLGKRSAVGTIVAPLSSLQTVDDPVSNAPVSGETIMVSGMAPPIPEEAESWPNVEAAPVDWNAMRLPEGGEQEMRDEGRFKVIQVPQSTMTVTTSALDEIAGGEESALDGNTLAMTPKLPPEVAAGIVYIANKAEMYGNRRVTETKLSQPISAVPKHATLERKTSGASLVQYQDVPSENSNALIKISEDVETREERRKMKREISRNVDAASVPESTKLDGAYRKTAKRQSLEANAPSEILHVSEETSASNDRVLNEAGVPRETKAEIRQLPEESEGDLRRLVSEAELPLEIAVGAIPVVEEIVKPKRVQVVEEREKENTGIPRRKSAFGLRFGRKGEERSRLRRMSRRLTLSNLMRGFGNGVSSK